MATATDNKQREAIRAYAMLILKPAEDDNDNPFRSAEDEHRRED